MRVTATYDHDFSSALMDWTVEMLLTVIILFRHSKLTRDEELKELRQCQ